jgi:hypothetical protein
MTFRRDLVGPRLATCNALLQCLAFVQFSQGFDEFRWKLNENGKFLVDSMYRALIQPLQPVVNNKKI